MSAVTELKKAAEQLSPGDRWEFFVWLRETEDVRTHQLEELRRDLAIGVEQANRGDVVPLDMSAIRAKVHQRAKQSVTT
ncbi:MAG TPA: hypothetical protein VH619_02505 [Verrucomicrobiae bacterium]|jgi:hypothetical protein|nr:hypothetical protein [Verrucomicrobiae bacterium]